jgi:DNA-directed RNA polymerase subunit RPC12/RpoP
VSQLLSRILLAGVAILAVPVIYMLAFMTFDAAIRSDEEALLLSDLLAGCYLVVAWILVWRPQVSWTPQRRLRTGLAVVWSLVPASAAAWLLMLSQPRHEEVAIIIGGMAWVVSWLGSSVLVWRETAVERVLRIKGIADGVVNCPNCGYNMTGLDQARCPECGSRYTLNELFAVLQEQTADVDTSEQVA